METTTVENPVEVETPTPYEDQYPVAAEAPVETEALLELDIVESEQSEETEGCTASYVSAVSLPKDPSEAESADGFLASLEPGAGDPDPPAL